MRHNASSVSFNTSESWVILSPIELSIKRKIESVGVPLRDWDINIYRGVLTGYNEAFIITTEKRNEILSKCLNEEERKRTEELIRPILRGRDIKRYGYDWAGLWLINTHNGIKGRLERIHIEDYPAVKAHLDQYWDKISTRADKGDTPYNLRNCAYLDDFNNQKIVWARLMRITKCDVNDFPRFALVPEGIMTVDSLCFFSGKDIEQICYFLNSEYATYYFLKNIVALDNGGLQMRQQYIEEIPLPTDSETSDSSIYLAFGFNKEEISFIQEYIRFRKHEILSRD